MMMNLFSSFDASSNLGLSLNWFSTLIGLLVIPPMFWLIPPSLSMFWTSIIFILHKEFEISIVNKFQGKTLIFVSLFPLILFNNFLGLFAYIFSETGHMTSTLALALPLWLSFMIYGWINNTIHVFAHSVPQGTLAVLMPFMVCIETISNIIRPGT